MLGVLIQLLRRNKVRVQHVSFVTWLCLSIMDCVVCEPSTDVGLVVGVLPKLPRHKKIRMHHMS